MEEIKSGKEIGIAGVCKNNPAELQLGVLKVQNESDSEARSSEVVEHSTYFVVCDALDGFCVHYDFFEGYQVRDILADGFVAVNQWIAGLLRMRNPLMTKFDNE